MYICHRHLENILFKYDHISAFAFFDGACYIIQSAGICIVYCKRSYQFFDRYTFFRRKHLLHILRGTDLAREWEEGQVETMTLEAYIRVLEDCVRHIPRELVIHRLTGDGAKRDLLAPLWSGDKKRVLNAIHQAFLRDDVEQGSALEPKKT